MCMANTLVKGEIMRDRIQRKTVANTVGKGADSERMAEEVLDDDGKQRRKRHNHERQHMDESQLLVMNTVRIIMTYGHEQRSITFHIYLW